MPDGNHIARPKTLLVADLFCGAGGSSTGARRAMAALGYRMDLIAVNHWNIAIETHSRNHPEARHYLRDLMAADPIQLVPEGKLDLLMASPTCTHHSRARGGRPSSDQQRMDPWAVIRWCSELRVKRLLVENVPEFIEWGPVDLRTGRPIKRRKGEYFKAWTEALRGLGFKVEWRTLNAADYGDATTRSRFFLMARSDGKRLTWPTPTHSKVGGTRYAGESATEKWRSAREIIDWAIEGRSIYGRKRSLAPATLARIYAGAVKFRWPEPYLVVLRQHMDAQSLDVPVPSITASGTHIGLAEPVLIKMHGKTSPGSIDDPASSVATRSKIAVAEPFVATLAHGSQAHERNPDARRCRSIDEPLQTIHAQGSKFAVVEPFVLAQGSNGAPRGVTDPIPTVLTAGKVQLIEPFMLSQASGGSPRGVDAPVPTITTGGNGSAHALICPYYGSGSGETCGSSDAPLPACTTKARFGLAVPVTQSNGGPAPRSIEEPLPTVTGAHRGELAVIVAQTAPSAARQWDIKFRMLQPHELAAAMGFGGSDTAYEFVGTKTEITKQIGNAVPVNTACALVRALVEG